MSDALVAAVVLGATALSFVTGFHDAPNAITTTIITSTLPRRAALAFAALLNLLGALLSVSLVVSVAAPIMTVMDLPDFLAGADGRLGVVLLAALATGIGWNILTWWWAMPSSSWHAMLSALIGGMLGAGFGWVEPRLIGLFVLPILASPVLGFILSYLITRLIGLMAVKRIGRTRDLRAAQTVSAGAVALAHGISNGRLPVGIALTAIAAWQGSSPAEQALQPGPLLIGSAAAMALALGLGTFAGGARIMRTLGRRLTDLTTPQGLAAETSTALVLYLMAYGFHAPVSSSQLVTSSIAGSAVAVSLRQVNWRLFGTIMLIWLVTPVVCAGASAVLALGLLQIGL